MISAPTGGVGPPESDGQSTVSILFLLEETLRARQLDINGAPLDLRSGRVFLGLQHRVETQRLSDMLAHAPSRIRDPGALHAVARLELRNHHDAQQRLLVGAEGVGSAVGLHAPRVTSSDEYATPAGAVLRQTSVLVSTLGAGLGAGSATVFACALQAGSSLAGSFTSGGVADVSTDFDGSMVGAGHIATGFMAGGMAAQMNPTLALAVVVDGVIHQGVPAADASRRRPGGVAEPRTSPAKKASMGT